MAQRAEGGATVEMVAVLGSEDTEALNEEVTDIKVELVEWGVTQAMLE